MLSRDFILAGRAIFTVSLSDGHQTYQVRRVAFANPQGQGEGRVCYFASLLTGPDNTSDYSYIGMLDPETGELRPTAKSRAHVTRTRTWKILLGALRLIWDGTEVEGVEIAHAGSCARCGRVLTDPVSLEVGIGPKCREMDA